MRVPVILAVPAHDTFRAAALASVGDMSAGLDIGAAPSYPGVELDAAFAPVPFGEGPSAAMASFEAISSPKFAVRGHVEVDTIADMPETAGEAVIYSDPHITPLVPTCGGTPPVGNAQTVANKLSLARLAAKQLDGTDVAIAIVDTGINSVFLANQRGVPHKLDVAASWSPPGAPPPLPGQWSVAHGTMCAFDVLIAAPNATLIDVPVLSGNYPGGGSIMSGTLSGALAAFSYLMQSWSSGALSAYKALVANNSWGIFHQSWDFPVGHPGRFCDNPNHPFNIQVGAAVNAGIDVIFAAGNCGAPCADSRCQGVTTQVIMGASAMQAVLTIAGCDTNDLRVGYSSQGPSIANMYQHKPDITGYTHFLGSEAFGVGSPDSGTSAACPVIAGCVAALRTSATASPKGTLSPTALFNALRANARQAHGTAGAWNGDYGFGIIDLNKTVAALNL